MDGPTATYYTPTLPTAWPGDFPFLRETVTLTKLEYIELKAQRNHFKALHERVLGRAIRPLHPKRIGQTWRYFLEPVFPHLQY